ncbi:MAG: enoyl-CoA hydratase/isomerase family protein [Myxococcota bacterium]|nr:enoyl-CoA hydratase-related protein [Myxococcota bacterium]
MSEFVRVSVEGAVAEIVIDRPKALNALNPDVLAGLDAACATVEGNKDLRCVIITGAGEKAFVAGADIAVMASMTTAEADAFARRGHAIMHRIEALPVPVIAAVNGFALGGGCELALACDIIYASETAKFGQPEVKLGLIPGFGGTVRLGRKVGYGAAAEWIFSGDIYDAQTAAKIGLVQNVVPPGELMGKVRALAQTIAKRSPVAVRAAKHAMQVGMGTDPHTAGNIEVLSFGQLFGTADMREGTKAFVEKREPTFTGR